MFDGRFETTLAFFILVISSAPGIEAAGQYFCYYQELYET